ncbi:hypothetical protein TNCT_487801 [Trichonephila clavata]|uniref:Uncharacterized protein n=1 Tax=Trichonephila clavata TaxID=2740835 RepID=A0A8X6GWP1_TRICU|nr:hypothetical protein TNCT_487801 [Trichonephila clavata]
MEITTLNRLRGALKAKVRKVELFGTGSEQSPSLLEVKLHLKNISALREKIELLEKIITAFQWRSTYQNLTRSSSS